MSSTKSSEYGPAPGIWLKLLEARAPFEHWFSIMACPAWGLAAGGDGHAVLVLPGLAASDASTLVMRRFLDSRGFSTRGWGQGMNLGLRDGVIKTALTSLRAASESTGRKVSLVGWSLGGLYARELAKIAPEAVRFVVTLGSPFTGHPRETNAWKLYEFGSGHKIDSRDLHTPLRVAPPVPTTSILSRTDGIVSWKCSVEGRRELAENILVESSHMGLGAHPAALYAIADRLAQPDGEWAPFDRSGWRAYVYGDPDTLNPSPARAT